MGRTSETTPGTEKFVIEKGQLVAGRYRLLDTIGSGAMGIVWQARDERLDRTVAIKQLLMRAGLSATQADDARRRAMREGRLAARLQHRNAIALFDVAEHDGDPCLIMEYLPSRSLSLLLAERGTLSPQEAARIGEQVATALTAAHAAGIVHRDVKPGNILIDDNGTVKITDFGISRAVDDGTMTQSSAGMLAGTPAYLAPEVARGHDPTRASDVFSLGATLYHAVEGQPPYGFKDNPLAQLYAVAMGNVPAPQNAGPLTEPLMRLLAADPEERPTMPEVVSVLAEVADGTTSVALPPRSAAAGAGAPTLVERPKAPLVTPPRPAKPGPPTTPVPSREPGTPPQRRDKRGIFVAAAVLAAAVLGAVIATLLSANSGEQAGQTPTPTPQPTVVTVVSTVPGEPPPQSPTPSSTPTAQPVGTTPSEGGIAWSTAGERIIAYYSAGDATSRWAMLTPAAQQAFGGFDAFKQYWAAYPALSSENARGVRPNPDNSVIVPVDVTYASGNRAHKELRVVKVGGQLLIDSDAR